MSTPTTWPVGPTSSAARKQSKPPPEPRSRTRAPTGMGPALKGLSTPAKLAIAESGSDVRMDAG